MAREGNEGWGDGQMNNEKPRNETMPLPGEPREGRGAGPGEPREGRGAEQLNGGPADRQVEIDSGETVATDNTNSANDVILSPNNATTANDETTSPSLTGTDTENPGGGESTGGQNSQNGQPAGAEVLPSTPRR